VADAIPLSQPAMALVQGDHIGEIFAIWAIVYFGNNFGKFLGAKKLDFLTQTL
jgi:hypothetical protein